MSFKIFESTTGANEKHHNIVLIHGFVSSQSYWKRLIPYLQKSGYKVVTIDLLGFGSSRDIPTTHYTYETHLDHIEKCLKDAQVQAPFVLVGHSMGALLSARYTTMHAGRVEKLILLHPPMYSSSNQARHTLHSTGKLYKFLLISPYRKLGWGLLKFLPACIANHRGKGREESLENIIMIDNNLQLIENPPVETLLIIGEKDRQIYVENLDTMLLSKKVTVNVIDANHHSARNKSEMLSEKILKFIK